MGKLLHRREKPQPQVVHRDVVQHPVDQRLVLGPDRTDVYAPAVLDLDMTLPLRGIGPHGEIRRARTAKLPLHTPDHDARVDGEHAGFIGQHRVDIEAADFGNVGGHLRQLDQNHRDGVRLHRRHVAIGAQQPRDAGALDQAARQLQVERRQRQRLVVDDLDRRAAAAEHDDGAEGRIVGEAENEFARLRPHHHRLHHHARNPRLRPQRSCPRENLGGRLAHRIGIGEIEHDAADIGFVHDVARHDLEHDSRALRKDCIRMRDRLFGIGGGEGRHDRDVIGIEQPLDLDRIEPGAAVGECCGNDLPRRIGIGRKLARHGGWNLRQRPPLPRDGEPDA